MTYMTTSGTQFYVKAIADQVKRADDPFRAAVAKMSYRDNETYRVVFHFEDGSTLTFKKTYTLED